MFCKVTLSRTRKSESGTVYSRISMGLPIFFCCLGVSLSFSLTRVPSGYTYYGNLTLHSSHSSDFQQYVMTYSPVLIVFFELSHSLKHSKWMWLMVPAHLQGEISGSALSFSSPKQIRHTFPSISLACSFSFIFISLCFIFFYFFFLILCLCYLSSARLV